MECFIHYFSSGQVTFKEYTLSTVSNNPSVDIVYAFLYSNYQVYKYFFLPTFSILITVGLKFVTSHISEF